VGFGARVEYMKPHAERIGYGLQVFRTRRSEWTCGVDEQSKGRRPGEQLTREFEPLRPYLYIQGGHARQVAAGSAQAGDKTQLDRVTPGREYDRNRRGRRFGAMTKAVPAAACLVITPFLPVGANVLKGGDALLSRIVRILRPNG